MGNAQTSLCFRAAWTKGEDVNDPKAIKAIWPLPVRDIDLVDHVVGDFMKGKKAAIIVNVASQ